VINRKAVFESVIAAIITTIACYRGLLWPAISVGLLIRHKMPDASFSGLIVLYAMVVDILVSIAIGGVAYWMVYKYATRSGANSRRSE
jgi:hypothetical protein